jgi:O-antigen/teichoic acid export membrane protein
MRVAKASACHPFGRSLKAISGPTKPKLMSTTSAPITIGRPHRSSLSADFTWTLVGNGVYSGGQWAMLMLIAKLTRPELVGQYALGLAVVLPVIMFTNLQLRCVVTTDVHEQRHFGDYLSFRLLSTALALTVVLGSEFVLGYRPEVRRVIFLVGLAQAIEAVSDIYYARLQLYNRMERISKSLMSRTVLSLVGLATAVALSGNLLWGIAAIVAARAAVLIFYDRRPGTHDVARPSPGVRAEALKPRWNPAVQRELLWVSFPLGLIAVLVSINSSIPRYFIAHTLGDRALGIFSALAFMLAAGSMAVVSLGQSAFTRLARAWADNETAAFRALLGKLMAWGAALGIAGIIVGKVAGRELLTLLFRPEYAEHADLVPWIMVAATVSYLSQFMGFGMTAAGCFHPQVALFFFSNVVVALASYWLIPLRGLSGAILAICLSSAVQLVGSIIILSYKGIVRRARPSE